MAKFSINEIIEFAVQIERSGYDFYNNTLARKDLNPVAHTLIRKLRDDERVHEATFKGLRSSENLNKLGDKIAWQEAASYLKTIALSHLFNEPKSSIKKAAAAKDDKDIIKHAIQFEKDTLLFFNALSKCFDDPKTKRVLDKIINEEMSHVTKLKKVQEKLT